MIQMTWDMEDDLYNFAELIIYFLFKFILNYKYKLYPWGKIF